MKNPKTVAVISYLTWVGWIAAFVMRDENDDFETHHINQSLIINIASIAGSAISMIPGLPMQGTIRGIAWCAVTVFWFIGIIRAFKGSSEPLPFIGDLHLI
ncbi:MAG: hypothetical protein IJH95_05105 [Mogibacterium sp.]|jgi:uncharacterized membrane protein|nr:hypothetical protein [Mogibacterium sp.]